MVCLGFDPGAAEWKAWTNPLSYGGTPCETNLIIILYRLSLILCIKLTLWADMVLRHLQLKSSTAGASPQSIRTQTKR